MRSEPGDRHSPVVINNYVDDSSPAGLARTQFLKIMGAITQMADELTGKIDALNVEITDLRTTVELIAGTVDSLKANLDAANAANTELQEQINQLTADAVVSQGTIDGLNASAASAATAIGEATTSLDTLDEQLETTTGEP